NSSKPSKSNNQADKNWASNIEQEEKSVGKGKQKATSSTNMVTEQDGPNTNVPNPNYLKENDSINTIDDQDLTFKENITSIPISKH
ncbi:16527_t:CDS:2, partial [Cetraspora pellucida]